MKPDQEKVRVLLVDTVALLCKNGLSFKKELKIQGLLGITVDENDVFIVHIDEIFSQSTAPARKNTAELKEDHAIPLRMVPEPVAEYNQSLSFGMAKKNTTTARCGPKSLRKRANTVKAELQPLKREKEDWNDEGDGTWTSEHNVMKDVMRDGSENGNSVDLEEEPESDDVLWIGPDEATSGCKMEFEPGSGKEFENENEAVVSNESYISSVNDLSHSMSCRESMNSSVQSEHGLEISSVGSASGRTHRRSGARRKSCTDNMVVPFVKTSASCMPSMDEGSNWDDSDRVTGLYPTATEIGWDNDDENVQLEDHQQFGKIDVPLETFQPSSYRKQTAYSKQSMPNKGQRFYVDLSSQSSPRSHQFVPKFTVMKGNKQFVCQYEGCSRTFSMKKHLTWHQREKHGRPFGVEREFSYPCQFRGCGRVFYKHGYLVKHMESEHGYDLMEKAPPFQVMPK